MQLATWFQISMAAQVAWSGLLLAIAEGRPSPQMISPVLAIAGLVLTDWRGTFRLTPGWASGVAFFGFCVALAELFAGGIEARLLWGAHLLVYLTWVLVFMPKTALLNWLLCALCLLQVAVGAVLMTRSGIYGGLVVLYFFLAVWTLSVFSLHQARERLEPGAAGAGAARRELWARERRGGSRLAPAFVEGSAAGLLPAAERLRAASQVQGAIQLDPHERWLRLRFVTGTFVAGAASLAVGLVFFLLTPRVWIGTGPPRDEESQAPAGFAVTGFSDNVQLGDFGEILTSPEPVFRVKLKDADTETPLDIVQYAWQAGMDEPLFRGAVMSRYIPNTGRWESAGGRKSVRIDGARRRGMVRQEISLEPIDTDVLFAMHPAHACRIRSGDRRRVAFQDPHTARLFSSRAHKQAIEYFVYSPRQLTGDEGDLAGGGVSQPTLRDQALPDLPQLVALARRVAGYREGAARPPAADMARRLLVYLRDSQQFTYSLDMTRADPSSDPIEDFLFRRRAGHCEYFASALTLLLRSVEIPARLVNGFKGGEPRDDGRFEVQRRHAHAWVEAFYDGRWHVLDPTPPAARLASVAQMSASVRSIDDLVDIVTRSWSKYVVGMDLSTQQRDFYQPLRATVQQLWDSMQGDRKAAASLLASARDFLSSPRRWFSWQGGIVTFVLLLFLSGCWWLVRRVWHGARYLWTRVRTAASDRGRRHVEFYERFRRACERQGLVRAPGQTQREYAGDVRRRLEPLLAGAGLGEFPAYLVELFYRVRFGEELLDRHSTLEVERRLAELEQALGTNRAAREKNGRASADQLAGPTRES